MRRFSLNQITTKNWTLPEAVAGCAEAGVGWIGLWRNRVAEVGVETAAALLRDHGVRASSLCRGGSFTGAGPDGPVADPIGDTAAAIDEAAALGAPVLVLVVGGIADGDLPGSRAAVSRALERLVPYAAERGVRLGLEPLHPVQCPERSVLCTLDQALDLAEPYPEDVVGVIVDEFHVWWDPRVEAAIARAGNRIAGFHASDQLVPLPDPLLGRGLPGEGPIDHRRLLGLATAAGYSGPVEVEVFNAALWARPPKEALAAAISAYRTHVAG